MKAIKYIIVLAVFFLFFQCKDTPRFPVEPVIEFKTYSKDIMDQGDKNDSLQLIIHFTDGDGDIGSSLDDNQAGIFIKDTRFDTPVPVTFSIPKIPEAGASNGIEGDMTIELYTTCCVFPEWVDDASAPCEISQEYPIDTLVYELYIEDRAGHKSNVLVLPPLYLRCK